MRTSTSFARALPFLGGAAASLIAIGDVTCTGVIAFSDAPESTATVTYSGITAAVGAEPTDYGVGGSNPTFSIIPTPVTRAVTVTVTEATATVTETTTVTEATATVTAKPVTVTSTHGVPSAGSEATTPVVKTGTLTTQVPGQGISATITYQYTSGAATTYSASVTVPTASHVSSSGVASASASVKPYTNSTTSSNSTSVSSSNSTSNTTTHYLDWSTFTANGVNLGCWLELEYSCYEVYWASLGTTALDEWDLCEQLGDRCEAVMIQHYANFMNESVIDALASVGVNTLRIPTTYAAWVDVPGSQLYHGNQSAYLKSIANYAIETYGMYIAVDLHSLPGGVNYLDIGEAYGHDYWFYNDTNLQYSLDAVANILTFFEETGHVDYFTLEPLNEAADNLTEFGTCAGLTTAGAAYVATYWALVLDMVQNFNPKIPVMFQVCFCSADTWTPYFTTGDNIVFDNHVYYFEDAGVYAEYADDAICGQAATLAGNSSFPTFVGEWSLQVTYNNTFEARTSLFDTQRYAWSEYVHGGSFWSAVHYGNATVSGEGTQMDYWSYLLLIEEGVITAPTDVAYC